MKYFNILILILMFISSCKERNNIPNWQKVEIDGLSFNQVNLPNKVSILCDSNYHLIGLESSIMDSIKNKLFFNSDGILTAKESMNRSEKLNGKNYYFHDNGDLKSIVTYKDGKKFEYGFDYYKNSGNLQNYMFYDSMGVFFYVESYTDTSTDVSYIFNPKNPNSYQLIKAKIPDPQKSKLLRMMEEIGLDSLKQIH